MRLLIIILSILLSINSLADKNRNAIVVNFYTLAANETELAGKRIAIRGWIGFYKFTNKTKIFLFPSKSSLSYYNISEAVEVKIPADVFESVKADFHEQFVTVYADYKISKKKQYFAFGILEDVHDIDLIKND